MLIKKFGSLLLALTLLVACIPGTMVTAEEAAWFDIEVENGEVLKSNAKIANASASNGIYMLANNTNAGNQSTISFARETTGTYDIWAVVGVKAANYLCEYEFTLDTDDVLYDKNMNTANTEAVGDALYTTQALVGSSDHPVDMKWVKIASAKEISAGDHTILAAVGKEHASNADAVINGGNAFGAIDVVRFVPSSWGWEPASNFDAPTYKEWIHIEAEDGIVDTSTTDNNMAIEGASAGAMMMSGYNYQNISNSAEVYIPASTNYDVWAVMGVPYNDASNNNRGSYKFSFGEEEPFFHKYNAQIAGSSDTIFSRTVNTDTYGMNGKWVRVGTGLPLTEGAATLNFAVTYGTDGTSMALGFIDCIRIVPSDWTWSPNANFDDPTDMTPVPDANGLIFLEGEKGILSGSMSIGTNASASNSGYACTFSSQNVGATTLAFKTTEDAVYDVWAAVGVPVGTGTHLGGYSFVLDENTIYSKNHSATDRTTPVLYGGDGTIYLHTGDTNGSNASVRWIKVAGDQQLAAGSHNIACNVIQGTPANSTGLIDCVAFIPSDWDWTAGDSLDIAKQFNLKDGSYAWIEGEWMTGTNTDAASVTVGVAGGTASNGSEIYRNAQGSADSAFAPEFTIDFYVDKAGDYKVWNFGYAYGSGSHFGKMHVAANGGEYSNGTADWESGTTTEPGTDGQVKRWNRRNATLTLNAGKNSLQVKYTYGGIHNLFCTDAIVIVPAEWNWTPADTSINAVSMAPVLDALSVQKSLAAQAAAGVTADLALADRGAAGSTITYASTNSAITNTGVVTIPSRWDGNAEGTITATATKDAVAASSEAVEFVVYAENLVDYASFEIVGEIEANGMVYAAATDITKAHDDATTAVVVLAVYKDNALVGVYPSDVATLSADAQTIVTAQATLPADITGVTVKAFLWNGLADAMPYVLPLDK